MNSKKKKCKEEMLEEAPWIILFQLLSFILPVVIDVTNTNQSSKILDISSLLMQLATGNRIDIAYPLQSKINITNFRLSIIYQYH